MNTATFLSLIRLSIGHQASAFSEAIDWSSIKTLAEHHGLSALFLDGVENLPERLRPSKDILLTWIGESMQNYECRYDVYCRTIADMAKFYNSHGLKMMVLKGYACSLNWPKPEHRPCGDIDIWLFGDYKRADGLVSSEKGIKVDNSHHHHTVFEWHGFSVENHYDFINVHHHTSNVSLEKIFKELGTDDTHFVELYGEKVFLPSPNLHALFLMKHLMTDFTAFSITIRQILDWGFFVEKHTKEVDWQWLLSLLDKYHMRDFFNSINGICVEDLGFDATIFPEVRYLPELKEKVLADVLHPAFVATEPKNLIPRLIYKYRRWKGNAWKHKLCYNESLWSAFWSGVWAHILKPSSI